MSAVDIRVKGFSRLVSNLLTYLTQNRNSIVDYCRRY